VGTVFLSVAINLIIVFLLYLIMRKRIRRLLDGGEALDAIRDEINHLIVELNQTSDRNIGIIEERIGRLKTLVDEADRKITLLARESEKVRLGADVYERLKKSKSLVAGVPRNTGTADDRSSQTVGLAAGTTDLHIADTQESEAMREAEKHPGKTTAEVLELHRQGFEPKLIAAKTGSTLGEIELIISLAGGRY